MEVSEVVVRITIGEELMDNARLLLQVEAEKKSGWIAALLNLVIPGAGYAYCGRWVLAVLAFLIVVGIAAITMGMAYPFLAFVMFVDGFLCANRHNKAVIKRVLAASEPSAT